MYEMISVRNFKVITCVDDYNQLFDEYINLDPHDFFKNRIIIHKSITECNRLMDSINTSWQELYNQDNYSNLKEKYALIIKKLHKII